MLSVLELAALLQPHETSAQIALGSVTGTAGTVVKFVLDGEDPTSLATRSASTLKGFTMSSTTTGSRILLARVNASYVCLGILA